MEFIEQVGREDGRFVEANLLTTERLVIARFGKRQASYSLVRRSVCVISRRNRHVVLIINRVIDAAIKLSIMCGAGDVLLQCPRGRERKHRGLEILGIM